MRHIRSIVVVYHIVKNRTHSKIPKDNNKYYQSNDHNII